MKKLLVFFLCLSFIFTASACGKKDNQENPNASISDINTAEADKENPEPSEEEVNPDRTEETDRQEIKANLRDAKDLIEDGYFEDAKMIIDGLKTRDLTQAEKDELLKLQAQMITVSD